MHEDLERLEVELRVALNRLNAREAQFAPRRNPEKWNIQQIVEHLLLTYRSTMGVVQVRLDKGTPTRAAPSMAQRLGQFGLLTLGYFPPGRKAPAAVLPSLPASLDTGEELSRRVHEELLALDAGLARSEAAFGGRRFASHTILGPLSAAQWRKFHLIHGLHHVEQMRRIRQDHGAHGRVQE